jgi:hypothetical protein
LTVFRSLQSTALDTSVELRRLIELSYAAEQAGFILDGTMLRNGGRVWGVVLVLASESGREESKAETAKEATATLSSTSCAYGADSAVESLNKPDATIEGAAATATKSKGSSGTRLRANL